MKVNLKPAGLGIQILFACNVILPEGVAILQSCLQVTTPFVCNLCICYTSPSCHVGNR